MDIDFEKLPKFKPFSHQILPLIDEWATAYDVPRDAIIRQLPWAHGWILSNPKKAPKSNMVRFLFSWMRKAHAFGNLRVADRPQAARVQHEPDNYDMTVEEMIAIRKKNLGESRRV